ncbi:NUDIX domain-containing protein [Stieleria sp. TO1_6]|uniref:NUDIX hydrolase n=1 Tax=Stieleria tagensis TaxID=2956795 RepID=UPI00209AF307|nr:NUDIX domain-containing protein [Stieleria tagensis]MCO8122696.1 NUDIX domain-containing protein [Stieleria tagensis]
MAIPIEQAYLHCPRCATAHQAPGKVPFRCSECGFAVFFGPVAAVGALIVNPANELLLVRRARDPGKGQWGLPGGFVDQGETVEQALEREVLEETQLRLTNIDLMMTFPNQYDYHGVVSQVIDLFYLCQPEQPLEIKLELSELDDYAWTHPGDEYLDNMAFASNRRAIEYWMAGQPTL